MGYNRGSEAERASDLAAAAAARHEQVEQEQARRSFSGAGDDGVPKVAITKIGGKGGRPALVRLLGRPAAKHKSGTDAKEIFLSEIRYIDKVFDLSDLPPDMTKAKRKALRCLWPSPEAGERPHILWRMHDKVMTYVWHPEIGEKGSRVYDYEQDEGDKGRVFCELSKNGMPNAKVVKGWKPKQKFLINSIDRLDMAWHRENKSMKLLCSSYREWTPQGKSDAVPVWEIGIPQTVYGQDLWDRIVENYGLWDDYDILMWKLSSSPWYGAKHISVEPQVTAKDGLTITDEMMKRGTSPLTEEECSWDPIDFDEKYPITSYRQIRGKLGYVFKLFDRAFDQHFYEELVELAEAEKEEDTPDDDLPAEALEEDAAPTSGWSPAKASATPPAPTAAPAPAQAPATAPATRTSRAPASAPAPAGIDWAGLADGTFNGTKYAGVTQLTDAEKALVVGVNADGSFQYVEGTKTLKNTANQFYSPESYRLCPLSGAFFE